MSEARTVHGEYAGFVSRLAAFLIDVAVVGAVTLTATWASVELLGYVGVDLRDCDTLATHRPILGEICHWLLYLGPLAGTTFIVLYGLFFWGTTGQTPGKAAMGVRVVRLDGRPMNLLSAARRIAGYLVSLWTAGLGFLVILSDDRRQAWHDRIAGTCVVYSWGSVPHPAQPRSEPGSDPRG
jgi:uncharacterized RDD family membrane protein YckC